MFMLQYLISNFLLGEIIYVSRTVPIYAKHLSSKKYERNNVKKVLGAETFSVLLTVSVSGDLFYLSVLTYIVSR